MKILELILAIVTSLGGIELIKWFYTRKSKGRLAKAEADIESIKANADEYHLIRERLDYLNKEMIEKEKRFAEQTEHLRKITRELIDKEMELGNSKAQVAELKAERKMKLCERRGCLERQPQSGY